MKKVLILTVTAGNGHNSAALALKQKLESTGEVEVKVVDFVKEYTSKLNTWTIDKGYDLAVGYLRPLYDAFYEHYKRRDPKKENTCGAQASLKNVNDDVLKLIYDFQPDVIYGTTYYAGMVLTNLKRVYNLPCKTIVCMLDYVVSPFWEATFKVDYLTLAHEDFRQELISEGFKDEQLYLTGIPVREQFFEVKDKEKAREELGLEKDLFTVFILFGGGHWHGGHKILKSIVGSKIKENMQIVIVNGRDEKTKKKIDKEIKSYPKNFVVKNYGFVKNIDVIMSASDVIVGKAGGLQSTESIVKGLPIICTEKIPGQEKYNIRFIESKGGAVTYRTKKQLISHINRFLQNPDELKKMSENLSKMRENGIQKTFELIMAQPNADYSDVLKKVDFGKVNKIVNRARKRARKNNK